MKHLVGRIKNVILGKVNHTTQVKQSFDETNLAIIKARKDILKELQYCKESGMTAGIFSSSLGDGMFVTGVEDIYKGEKEIVVVLKPYDVGGNILVRNYLAISEIKSVCPLPYTYRNPFIRSEMVEANIA